MKKNFWENFIFVSIVLSIIQTFMEEFSRYLLWNVDIRVFFFFAGFFFDFVFTVEFIVRSILASRENKLKLYLLYRRGWVDFMSSIPLLLFSSGLGLVMYISGGSFQSGGDILRLLKIAKIIRIARILRLMRIMKIFGKIHYAESVMAERHISTIITIITTSIVILSLVFSFISFPDFNKIILERKKSVITFIKNFDELKNNKNYVEEDIKTLVRDIPYILFVYYDNLPLYKQISKEKFKKYYEITDYYVINYKRYRVIIDLHAEGMISSGLSLLYFSIDLFLVFVFLFVYSRHFVQTISDPIYIIYKGFSDENYYLEVKIREEFKEDEVFKLAEEYNKKYLPQKIRKKKAIPDITNIFKGFTKKE